MHSAEAGTNGSQLLVQPVDDTSNASTDEVLKWAPLWLAVQLHEQLLVQEIWDPTASKSRLLHRLQLRQREKRGWPNMGLDQPLGHKEAGIEAVPLFSTGTLRQILLIWPRPKVVLWTGGAPQKVLEPRRL